MCSATTRRETPDLKHNWITAVVRLGTSGWWEHMAAESLDWMLQEIFAALKATATMEINPNAMLVTPRHVLAGTLGKGLYVYDREKSRWSAIT